MYRQKIMKLRNRSGSALVLTVLMVSILSTVSFSITALSISELRKATALEDSITAFYAAESGIEHGLLQYRLWRNAEISQEMNDHIRRVGTLPVPEGIIPTKKTGNPLWFQVTGSRPGAVVNGDKGRASYGLKMYYRGGAIGKVGENGKPVVDDLLSPKIYRDSALPLSTTGADKLVIAWRADEETRRNIHNETHPVLQNKWRMFIEIVGYNPNSTKLGPLCPSTFRDVSFVDNSTIHQIDVGITREVELKKCDYETIKIKPWNMVHMQYSATLVGEGGEQVKFDNGMQSIISVGVSGKAKRELRVNLPRTNKTVLEAEDFLFISGGDDLGL